ncbi:MAG: glutamate 5-kinase [Flavisolibacter sp.]
MEKPVLVIKIGSSVIADHDGNLDPVVICHIVQQIADLFKDYRLILVSSGAVSSGKNYLKEYKKKLIERKAAAAVGNPILLQEYRNYLSRFGIPVAQALLERHHFSNRQQFLQMKETITELWKNDILTIVNENDFISDRELKFSDNDELATLMAVAFNAAVLLLCTTAGGYMNDQQQIIPFVDNIDGVLSFLRKDASRHGTGGMASKLTFTKLATSLGIKVVICGIQEPHSFLKAINGQTGTTFKAQVSTLKERQKWLASGSITIGSVQIDEGACLALKDRKSLLAIGIAAVHSAFSPGEVVQLLDRSGNIIGVAKMKIGSGELEGNRKNQMAAHANDIVIF